MFKHIQRTEKLSGIKDAMGSGVCVIDFNQDGYDDVFVVGGEGVTRRYGKNIGGTTRQVPSFIRISPDGILQMSPP